MALIKTKAPVTPVSEADSSDKEIISVEPTTIGRLITRANDIQAKSQDYNVSFANTNNLRFNESAGLTFISDEDGSIHSLPVSRHALGQLCNKIGVPARYTEKCIQSGRIDLAQDNVNSWLDSFNRSLFVREYDGRVRGVLSDRYSVCDTHEILEVMDSAINFNDYTVKGSFLNEERFHLRLVGKEMLPVDGEDLFAGLFVDSSDVGRNLLTVRFGIYKQICTNGCVIARAGGLLFQQKHIGISHEEFYNGLVASLENVDILTENAVAWVTKAQHKENRWSSASKLDDDINEFVNYIKNHTGISTEHAGKVIELMNTKYGDTRWGLINGVTEVAQEYTLEKRLEIERAAGNLLVA